MEKYVFDALDEPQPEVYPNRHVTLFIYLNEDFEGGETVFPHAKGRGVHVPRPGMPECSEGLSVEPVAGDAVLFYSRLGNGDDDRLSVHGGCPPLSGTKYGANAFMWNVPHERGMRIWDEKGFCSAESCRL